MLRATDLQLTPSLRREQQQLAATLAQQRASLAVRTEPTSVVQQRYEAAIDQWRALQQLDPDSDAILLSTAHVEADFATWLHTSLGHADALSWYRSAEARANRLAARDPRRVSVRLLLARLTNDIGLIHHHQGQIPAAQQSLTKSRTIWERLAADFSQRPAFQLGFTAACDNLASVHHDLHEYAAAEALLRESMARSQALLDKNPRVIRYRERLAETCYNLAIILQRMQRRDEQLDMARTAIAEWQRLVDEQPTEPTYLTRLAQGYRSLAIEVTAADSLPLFESSEQLFQQLRQNAPDNPEFLAQLSSLYDARAARYAEMNDAAGAVADFQRSLELTAELCRRWPQVPDYLGKRSRRHRHLGDHFLRAQEFAAAINQYRQALQLEQQLERAFPDYRDANYLTPQASLHLCLAASLVRAGGAEAADAQIHYQQAGVLAASAGTIGRVLAQVNSLINDADQIAYYQAAEAQLLVLAADQPPESLEQQRRFPVLVDLSIRLIATERWDEAAGALDAARALAPFAVSVQPKPANVWLCLQTLNWPLPPRWNADGNLALARQLVAVAPQEASYWNTLASAHIAAEQWNEALEVLNHTLRIRTTFNAYDWALLARCHRARGEHAAADTWLNRLRNEAGQQLTDDPVLARVMAAAAPTPGSINAEVTAAEQDAGSHP